jgi:hypothetical protein
MTNRGFCTINYFFQKKEQEQISHKIWPELIINFEFGPETSRAILGIIGETEEPCFQLFFLSFCSLLSSIYVLESSPSTPKLMSSQHHGSPTKIFPEHSNFLFESFFSFLTF